MRYGDIKILSMSNVLERLGIEEKKDRPPVDEEGSEVEGGIFVFNLVEPSGFLTGTEY